MWLWWIQCDILIHLHVHQFPESSLIYAFHIHQLRLYHHNYLFFLFFRFGRKKRYARCCWFFFFSLSRVFDPLFFPLLISYVWMLFWFFVVICFLSHLGEMHLKCIKLNRTQISQNEWKNSIRSTSWKNKRNIRGINMSEYFEIKIIFNKGAKEKWGTVSSEKTEQCLFHTIFNCSK